MKNITLLIVDLAAYFTDSYELMDISDDIGIDLEADTTDNILYNLEEGTLSYDDLVRYLSDLDTDEILEAMEGMSYTDAEKGYVLKMIARAA